MNATKRRRKENPRKAEFRAALALNRETAAAWAKNHNVKPGHLSAVLAGDRDSGRLETEMDAYIADFRSRVSRSATAMA
jgi:hypothetical protein